MYGDSRVCIERATNGYTVTMKDPKIVAANQKRDSSKGPYQPYQDPEKTYVFTDLKAVTTFLTANLDKALPKVDYESSFDIAAEEAGED